MNQAQQLVQQVIYNSLKDVDNLTISPEQVQQMVEIPKNSQLGDFAFPTFRLAKQLHQAPVEIAQNLAKDVDSSQFTQVCAQGPYVNFFLQRKDIASTTIKEVMEQKNNFGSSSIGENAYIPIDMSSPNIAKPMSMGHLRSTVIGNSIALILNKLNYHPVKINHLGDWGTQFGKLMIAYKKWGSEADVKKDPITNLQKYYVKFHKLDKEHPELDEEAREWFKKLENGDEEATQLWQWFRSESLKSFMKIYDELGITFDSYNGEAFYNDKMDEILDLLEHKGLLQESKGAEIVDLGPDMPPALIKKSDGATLYITRDLAAALYRKRTYHFKKSLYVVGSEQSNHFEQLKAVLAKMGFTWAKDIEHIKFGLITTNGKKLSTREGRVILLENVLHDSVQLAQEQIEEKNPTLTNKEQVAHAVGVGAVIFHDLKNNRTDSFDFNLEDVVRFEGETGPYVQYTHARAMSILRKAGSQAQDEAAVFDTDVDDVTWDILKHLANFPETVQQAAQLREPSVIAKYALHLAKSFNHYYAQTKVLVDDDQLAARLNLVQAVAIVLKEALRLLGVQAPDEM
ncbi:arginine--tRNA ligase [Lactobacillus sp. W8089]|nr:arginine--tRNA ligase [Lactobacillus sp. W8086]MBI0109088.1 arginine--tRNA ligase [Lactobacillus sp. W8085]MBI0112527.1 arginine--tRNA ligase [Lactobacillus sp. W8088]MBI0116020.1 arginine--tRNA ligase [Lactobacillus sp. W8087]MBI0119968.1 arginine--tRNA ligase [Lactobacillus sp. W8089]MBI0131933.1 arginine--tRNA ligase [Lactobacillus sp. W8090]